MVSTNLCSWFHLLQKGLNIVVSSISFILKITKDNERIKYYPQKNFTQFKSGSSIETWKKTAGPKNIVHMGKGIAREKLDWRNNCKKEETNLSAVISENFVGFQDMIKFPTQSKLPSYSTPFTVNPVSLNLQYH